MTGEPNPPEGTVAPGAAGAPDVAAVLEEAERVPPLPALRSRKARALRALLWVGLVALAGFYLRGTHWRQLLVEARQADLRLLLAVALVGNGLLAFLKARRAHLLLRPIAEVPTQRLVGYFVSSWAADNVLMSQAGVGVRVALVRREGVPLPTAVAIEALQKVLEAASLAPLVVLAALSRVPARVTHALHEAGWAAGLAFVALGAAVFGVRGPREASLSTGRLRRKLHAWFARIRDASTALRSPLTALEVLGLCLACWMVDLLMAQLTLRAMGLPAQAATAALVVVAVNIAALLPGLPGNVGTYEAAATIALGAVGMPHARALGFALVFHALHTVPYVAAGLPALRRVRRRPVPASSFAPPAR